MTEEAESKALQIGNKAGGDIVARDKNTFNLPPQQTTLSTLSEQYKLLKDSEDEMSTFIASLMHYVDSGEDVEGLEQKLLSGGKRPDFIERAKRHKELFAKRLVKRELSITAQKIFVVLLGKVKGGFEYKILPRIKAGRPESEVESAVFDDIVNPICNELADNVLDLTLDEISGMLYFLTGNCHIRWD